MSNGTRRFLILGIVFGIGAGGCARRNPSAADLGRLVVKDGCEFREGAIIRGPKEEKKLALVFTGHEFAEGATTILDALAGHKARASFFLTGVFLDNPEFRPLVQRIHREGHYLGPHSDQHLLYCPWEGPKRTLVSRAVFDADFLENVRKIKALGRDAVSPGYFLPPYEHYNQEVVDWAARLNYLTVNYTPGTRSNADYTGEDDRNFVSSQAIFDSIVAHETKDPHGLNGFILLLHIGAGPGRADKFHARFGELMEHLERKGYQVITVEELIGAD